jgi:hypothetical protein
MAYVVGINERTYMKTIKVSEATTIQLDWLVLKAQGQDFTDFNLHYLDAYHYSTDWAWGGPIIEREKIELVPSIDGKVWYAESLDRKARIERCLTPLIAAMRCYVTSKLGDTIEIPLELTQEA